MGFPLTLKLSQMQCKNAKLVSSKVQCSSNDSVSRIRDFSGVQEWLDRVEKMFMPFYLAGITKEFVNECLGSKDLGIYQYTIPNIERDTKESGVKEKIIYLRSPPLDHRELGHWRLIQAGMPDWSIVRMNQLQ